MSGSGVAYQADCIYPPRVGQISVFATSAVTASVDLRTLGPQQLASLPAGNNPPGNYIAGQQRKGLTGKYIRITAVTTPCYVAFANTSALAAAITTASTGANTATNAVPIAAGTYQDFWIPDDNSDPASGATSGGPCTWLGYVSTGAGFVCIAQASP